MLATILAFLKSVPMFLERLDRLTDALDRKNVRELEAKYDEKVKELDEITVKIGEATTNEERLALAKRYSNARNRKLRHRS
jgi:hypothetical protein